MKANEAPEKLYLSDFTDTIEPAFYVKRYNTQKNDIEYTRTDAFIEKACEWLKDNASNYIIDYLYSSKVDFKEDKMIEDFKQAMEN